jgi:sulfur-oxidizing protein SoxB
MRYACDPTQTIGRRINAMTLNGKPIEADRRYKVASWAPVAEGASGQPVWDLVAAYLRDKKVLRAPTLNRPALLGVGEDAGIARDS